MGRLVQKVALGVALVLLADLVGAGDGPPRRPERPTSPLSRIGA